MKSKNVTFHRNFTENSLIITASTDQMQAFDFVRILRQYVGLFSGKCSNQHLILIVFVVSEPVAALQYYCVIRAQAVNAEDRSIR